MRTEYRRTFTIAFVVLLLFSVGEAMLVSACPMCREAVDQSGSDAAMGADVSQNGLGRGLAWSIYLMLAVPYLLVGLGGFAVWRGIRRTRPEQTVRSHVQTTAQPRPSSTPATESHA